MKFNVCLWIYESSGQLKAPSTFDRQNTLLLSVIPLSPFFKISTIVNLGRLILALITAPPVLQGYLSILRNLLNWISQSNHPVRQLFLQKTYRLFLLFFRTQPDYPFSPVISTISLRSYPHYYSQNDILPFYSSSFEAANPIKQLDSLYPTFMVYFINQFPD